MARFVCLFLAAVLFTTASMGSGVPAKTGSSNTLHPRSIFSISNYRGKVRKTLNEISLRHTQGDTLSFGKLESLLAPVMKANPYSGLDLMDPRVPKFMDSSAQSTIWQAKEHPGDSTLQYRASIAAARNQDSVNSVRYFLRYYNLVRTIDDNAEYHLEPLPLSLDKIHECIVTNLHTKELPLHELEFLFAEMIRRLKALGDEWPRDGNLSKEKIYSYIFQRLLGDWQNLESLGGTSEERADNIRRLCTIILCHLIGVKGILGFEYPENSEGPIQLTLPQIRFCQSTPNDPYNSGLPEGVSVFLESAQLSYADLREAQLALFVPGPALTYQDWWSADVNFSNANLRGADMSGCLLVRVNFSNANLMGIDMRNERETIPDVSVNFSNADNDGEIIRTSLAACTFKGANLRGAKFQNRSIGSAFRENDLRGASFRNASFLTEDTFSESDIRGADFSYSKVIVFHNGGAFTFEDCDIRGADFRFALLHYVCFVDSNLQNTDLRYASLVYPVDNLATEFQGSLLNGARIFQYQIDQNLRGTIGAYGPLSQYQISTMIVEKDPPTPSKALETAL